MQTLSLRTNHNRNIPILRWEVERITKIPILHLPPRRAALERWPGPLIHPWHRKRFIFLNRPCAP
jgi:hypothetical protein